MDEINSVEKLQNHIILQAYRDEGRKKAQIRREHLALSTVNLVIFIHTLFRYKMQMAIALW